MYILYLQGGRTLNNIYSQRSRTEAVKNELQMYNGDQKL